MKKIIRRVLGFCLTTYQTIDTLGAYGNNGYNTAEEHFLCSGSRYKKPFAVERA